MPKHFRSKIEQVTRTKTTWNVVALFRRSSRAVEFQSFRNVETEGLNRLLSDPALIRIEILGSKKEVVVETKRVPLTASQSKASNKVRVGSY